MSLSNPPVRETKKILPKKEERQDEPRKPTKSNKLSKFSANSFFKLLN